MFKRRGFLGTLIASVVGVLSAPQLVESTPKWEKYRPDNWAWELGTEPRDLYGRLHAKTYFISSWVLLTAGLDTVTDVFRSEVTVSKVCAAVEQLLPRNSTVIQIYRPWHRDGIEFTVVHPSFTAVLPSRSYPKGELGTIPVNYFKGVV